ncbi:MAG TPA: M13 family metallopeptidase [Bacteroidota bacterium]|nr:M13 family metallopeptidase [Bacteroidota bacterium]
MTKRNVVFCAVAGLSFLFVGAGLPHQPNTTEVHGLNPANMDPSVSPATDFFQYANGGWLAKNPVPAEYSRWGSFEELTEKNYSDLKEILESAENNGAAQKGTNLQRVGDLYASAMDTVQAEQEGLTPIADLLARIESVKSLTDFSATVAYLHAHGFRGAFAFYVAQDAKASTNQIAQLAQGGLGLPDRDYYTKEDEHSKMLRDEYVKHVAKMFELAGATADQATASAKTIMDIETALANASMTRVQRRDPNATYHKMKLADLEQDAPAFSWATYFAQIGTKEPGMLNVEQPDFFKAESNMLKERPIADWKTYLRWHVLHEAAPMLSKNFVTANFDFFGKTMTGAKEMRPRWKFALNVVNGSIGEALGMLYVQKYFPPQAKQRALEMVQNLKDAFRERIQTREWMSDETKFKALGKLDAFQVKIGYPDKWKSYTGLAIDRGPLVLNVMRADSFEFQRDLAKIGQPVDRTEWGMTPPTVNAYYNPSMNEIVFPAGILQPPFFDPNADDAVNYGGMGAVIGHEMTHGFDDEGSQFDAKGNLADWWTPVDKIAFTARTQFVEREYDAFTPIDTLHLNGKLTLGENIADLGGLTIAHAALEKALAKHNPGLIDGLTPDQRFFLAWAQMWRANYRPEELRRRLIIDPHSPGKYRTIGPVVNIDAFYTAFNVKEGDPMYRPVNERAKIW